ncbi:PaaI family thioesterase [Ktedonosporobacter rubrisoli]|uniref:PaaI family thioesterase n=2 Tax=Ktedonosporobacter rubrisoli TaxID=2509675 RepID=A0A4V0Z0L6_KTERU|nr:PaaI family thioesterase [Ktedonosporobacter rubrisoli]
MIRQFLPLSPYVTYLGIQLTTMERDLATLTLPFREPMVTIGTVVHGGAIASLIDTAAMVAAWSGAEQQAKLRGSTVGLTVSYLAPAQQEDIIATARVLRRGRSLVYLDVEVSGASGNPVARGLVTYKLG